MFFMAQILIITMELTVYENIHVCLGLRQVFHSCYVRQVPTKEVYYRPQRSWAKVMFLQVSVILFTGGGVCLSACWDTSPGADTPQSRPPGADIPPGQTPPRSRHPTGSRHPPRVDTPPGADTHPPEQTPPRADPPGKQTPAYGL